MTVQGVSGSTITREAANDEEGVADPQPELADTVFLIDVDNTLLDNDRFGADLDAHLDALLGIENRHRYRRYYEQLRDARGYADYLGALQLLRDDIADEPKLLRASAFFFDYPFEQRHFPQMPQVLAHLRRLGPTVILSDGDVVFQPHKVQRAGIWQAVEGRVLIGVHKEQMAALVRRLYPAQHYVMIDDKPNLLARMKTAWGAQLTTVFVNQGHYAAEQLRTPQQPLPDHAVRDLSDLLDTDIHFFAPRRSGG